MKITTRPDYLLLYFMDGDFRRVADECRVTIPCARRHMKKMLAAMGYHWRTSAQKERVKEQLRRRFAGLHDLA